MIISIYVKFEDEEILLTIYEIPFLYSIKCPSLNTVIEEDYRTIIIYESFFHYVDNVEVCMAGGWN